MFRTAEFRDRDTVAAAILGGIERAIGAGERDVRQFRVARRADGDADAEGHAHRLAGVQRGERAGPDRAAQPLGGAQRDLFIRIGHRDEKFLAADARDEVGGPEVLGEPVGDRHQNRIPDRVAVYVVDLFEMIEIGEQQRIGPALLGGPFGKPGEMRQHVAAVVEAGERIGHRRAQAVAHVVAQPVGGALAVDLLGQADQQLFGIEPAGQKVVRPEVQRAGGLAAMGRVGDVDDGRLAQVRAGAQLRQDGEPLSRNRGGGGADIHDDEDLGHRVDGAQGMFRAHGLDPVRHAGSQDGGGGIQRLTPPGGDQRDPGRRPEPRRRFGQAERAARVVAQAQFVRRVSRAQQAAQPRQQDQFVDRLRNHVIRPGGERPQALRMVGAAVDQDDRGVVGIGLPAHPQAEIPARHVRQIRRGDHEIRPLLPDETQGIGPGLRLDHIVKGSLQLHSQGDPIRRHPVGDQYPSRHDFVLGNVRRRDAPLASMPVHSL